MNMPLRSLAVCAALLLAPNAHAGLLRDRLHGKLGSLDTGRATNAATETVAYGNDPHQRFDVYIAAKTPNAPVIFMVHGGGWRRGDMGSSGVVDNKFSRWGDKGIVFISANYRMLPEADPYAQAEDVARALAAAQRAAERWGADPHRFVLMGHSAGAHLVALLAASPGLLQKYGALPPLASVSLDSATLDVVQTMEGRHMALHDDAFGKDRNFWIKASPWHALTTKPAPILAVCSTRRADACPQAQHFIDKAKSLGGVGAVLREDMSHAEINGELGKPGAYTDAVEDFLRQADPALRERLR